MPNKTIAQTLKNIEMQTNAIENDLKNFDNRLEKVEKLIETIYLTVTPQDLKDYKQNNLEIIRIDEKINQLEKKNKFIAIILGAIGGSGGNSLLNFIKELF